MSHRAERKDLYKSYLAEMKSEVDFFNMEVFTKKGIAEGTAHSDNLFGAEYVNRYNIDISVSLPVPFKGSPPKIKNSLETKVKKYLDGLYTFWAKPGTGSFGNYDSDDVEDKIKTLIIEIKNDYVTRLIKDIDEWTNFLATKRRITAYKAKDKSKLPGSEYWNSIYAGGSNFCPLNSFVPGSPPSGFIYAGDKRFHQFILKQGE